MTPQQQKLLDIGRESICNEIAALARVESSLDVSFIEAVELMLRCRGGLSSQAWESRGNIERYLAVNKIND